MKHWKAKAKIFLLILFGLLFFAFIIKILLDPGCQNICEESSKDQLVLTEQNEQRTLCKCYYATGEYNSIKIVQKVKK